MAGEFPFQCEQTAASADGLDVAVTVEGKLGVYADPLDARAFEARVARHGTAAKAAAAVAAGCMPEAVRRVCGDRNAETLEQMTLRDWRDALAEGAKAALFEAGLEIVDCSNRHVHCEELAHRRAETAEAEAVAHRHRQREKADVARHETQMAELDRRAELLARYRELRKQMPSLSVSVIARHFSDVDREALYRLLIATESGAATTKMLWAVSGGELLGWEGGAFEMPLRRLRVSVEAGALRSVSVLTDGPRPRIAVGGQKAVALVEPDPFEVVKILPLPGGGGGKFGVNAVRRIGRCVWATHSGIGLIAWPGGEACEGKRMFAEMIAAGGTVRGLCQCSDGRLALATGDRVLIFHGSMTGADPILCGSMRAEITALLPIEGAILVALADGRVLRQSLAKPDERSVVSRHGSAITDLVLLNVEPPRLIVADNGFGLRCRVLGEAADIESIYVTADKRCRWAAAAGDYVYAVTTDRNGLLVWRVGEPRTPAHWINVRRQTHHSVSDLAVQL